MKDFYVYCHTSPSGKKYVGISKDPLRRWNNGDGYKHNFLFYRAIKKYGWDNIKHEILFSGLTCEEAEHLESSLIKQWDLINPRFGYNLRDISSGSLSQYTRTIMSKSQTGNTNCVGRKLSSQTRSKISTSLQEYYKSHDPTFLGKNHSQETIQKLKNRIVSEETRNKMSLNHADVSGAKNPSAKAVIMLSLSGEPIEEFEYAKLATKKYNLDLSQIIKCCRGKAKSCGGYRWQYK